MRHTNLIQQKFIFFSTQLLLKVLLFELNKNHFVFNRTKTVDMQSIVGLLQIIHDFLISGDKVISSVCIFLVVSISDVP